MGCDVDSVGVNLVVAVGAGAVMDGDSSCAGGDWGGNSVVKAPTLLQAL